MLEYLRQDDGKSIGSKMTEAEILNLDPTQLEARKWIFERDLKLAELEIKRSESARLQWRNPIVVAVTAAAIAGAANLVAAQINGDKQAALEEYKSEQSLVLQSIKTDDVKASAANLKFLVETQLLRDSKRRKAINEYLTKINQGKVDGPVLPSGGTSAISSPAASTQPHYDFPILNKAPIDTIGWDIDVFACGNAPARQSIAERFANTLAEKADNRSPIGGQKVGRVRLTSGLQWQQSNVIIADPSETSIAQAISGEMKTTTGLNFQIGNNTETVSKYYLSVFFCGV